MTSEDKIKTLLEKTCALCRCKIGYSRVSLCSKCFFKEYDLGKLKFNLDWIRFGR